LKSHDFFQMGLKLQLNEKQMDNALNRFFKKRKDMEELILNSFLSEEFKKQYTLIFSGRWQRLFNQN